VEPLDFPTNIRLGCMRLAVKNGLAYNTTVVITNVKCFIVPASALTLTIIIQVDFYDKCLLSWGLCYKTFFTPEISTTLK